MKSCSAVEGDKKANAETNFSHRHSPKQASTEVVLTAGFWCYPE